MIHTIFFAFALKFMRSCLLQLNFNVSLQSLKSKLDILGMPTDQLIVLFYSDFLERQQEQSKTEKLKYGELVVSAGFIKGSSAIEVTVIHGENMG